MPFNKFIAIARASNVTIYASNDASVSFFSSPFAAHRALKAVDIYPSNAEFGDKAVSPVNGVIKAVRKYPSPNLYPDRPHLYEYLILIECTDNPEICAKILHVRPLVNIGDVVHIDDPIGIFSRSGYIPFWADPHIHVELRSYKDPIRAEGAYPLEMLNRKHSKMSNLRFTTESILTGTVTDVESHYTTICLKEDNCKTIGNFSGLKARVGSCIGILDGGVPHVNYGGVLVNETVRKGDPVSLAGIKIGEVIESLKGLALFKITNFKVMVNNCEFQGIVSRFHLENKNLIKFIPLRPGKVNLNVDATVTVKLKTSIYSSRFI
jgi:hypothetical protein